MSLVSSATFLHLSFSHIAQVLSPEPVLRIGKQAVLARSEIGTARRVVKQLPAQMLQQCPCASSCMWMRSAMEEHYTMSICQHSTPLVLSDTT
jgi:hypothetical protein